MAIPIIAQLFDLSHRKLGSQGLPPLDVGTIDVFALLLLTQRAVELAGLTGTGQARSTTQI